MLPGPVSRLPGQHHGQVTALACAYLDGRPVAYSGGQDGMVRVWDLLDRHLLEIIDVPGPIFAIHATAEGDLLIGADGEAMVFHYSGIPGQR